ncbi:hypothetical protein NDU88_005343 [Pleurodeles waltl]|uniref:Uncharacterized protein n=1 Tax=Pleurodeles waltl TaxID=8319 RepID=A0AAV7QIQ5_PLEWA|nr:hypothetical protein NDU88_005343 [Pleurodeles waltl]
MGIGSGILLHPLHGFTDPSGGGNRRALVAVRGHPRQSGAYLGCPVRLGRGEAHPPVWEAPPEPRPPQRAEERQQGAQRSGRPLAPTSVRRTVRSGKGRGSR